MFALGAEAGAAEDNRLWRVCQIRPLAGIPHALIEQLATGVTKTIAVSVLLGDRTFTTSYGRAARRPHSDRMIIAAAGNRSNNAALIFSGGP